jgi:hypothetical protein
MKTILSTSLLIMLASSSLARPVAYWPYDKLTREADLIVIATQTQTEDTGEKMDCPGIARDNKPVPALGVNTTFQVLAILKGAPDLKSFVLFHLREAEPQTMSVNGPALVSFDPTQKKRYLLFLKKAADGRFTSLCGQTDPAGAVKDLGVYP